MLAEDISTERRSPLSLLSPQFLLAITECCFTFTHCPLSSPMATSQAHCTVVMARVLLCPFLHFLRFTFRASYYGREERQPL